MVPFDVVAGGDCVISNSGGVTHLRKGLKMLHHCVMQSSLCFADIESVTIPATGFVYDLRFLRAIQRTLINFGLFFKPCVVHVLCLLPLFAFYDYWYCKRTKACV